MSVLGSIRKIRLTIVIVSAVASGCRRPQAKLYPTHIEVPDYDMKAHMANIYGEVIVTATVDASGNVVDAHASGPPMLTDFGVKNIRSWTFEKPKHAPFEQRFTYQFKLEGEPECGVSASKVNMDLPDRATIIATPFRFCDYAPTARKD
jgi:hypothetical protein